VKQLTRILGTCILLGLLAWVVDWSKLGHAFATVDFWYWLLAASVLVVGQVVSSIRWRMLARLLHFDGSLPRYVAYYFIGMLFNLVLPTSVGGDVVRSWYLSVQEGSPPAQGRRTEAFLCVFAERFSGVIMLVLLGCVSLVLCPTPLPWWISGSVMAIGTGAVLGLLFLTYLAWHETPRGTGLWGRLTRLPVVQRLVLVIRRFGQNHQLLFVSMVLSLIVQVGSIVMSWLLAQALGLDIPWPYLGVVVPLVTLLTLLPVSVNGMGLREASTVLLLQPLGVLTSQAVAWSLLHFAVLAAVSLTFGLGCYLFGRFPRLNPIPTVSTDGDETRGGDWGDREVWEVARNEDLVCGNSNQGRAGQSPAAA
jgi:glycosyltransferase 2 family protein